MRIQLVSMCLLASAAVVLGQSDRGTITGTVADPAGAVVANAPIEAKNAGTGAVFQAASSDTGNYTLAQLPVGRYVVEVSTQGFKTFRRENVTIAAAQTLRLDITMEVGATSESVTVTGGAPLLTTENGALVHNVTISQMTNLPILTTTGNFRDPFGARPHRRDPCGAGFSRPRCVPSG